MRRAISLTCALGLLLLLVSERRAIAQPTPERLTAPQLFPEKTLAYIRVDDVKQLKADLDRSSVGRLGNDPQLKPIFSEIYGSLVNTTQQLQEATGLNLDEILTIPSGELAVGLFASDALDASDRRGGKEDDDEAQAEVRPVVAILMDAGDEIAGVRVLLDRLDQAASNEMEHTQKNVGRLTLHRYDHPNRRNQKFAYFIDGGVLVACSAPEGLEQMAEAWIGGGPAWSTLADNKRFTSILSRCVGTQGERPQVSYFVDPMSLLRQFAPKNASTTTTLAMLPAFGFDGIQAIGGSWIVAPPDFDSISHFHLLLGSPRRSILAMLRPKAGSTTPEDWVSESVASYNTINWDIGATVAAIEQLYNQFRGPDALENEVFARVNQQLEIDLRKDVLNNMEGRLTIVQGFVRPVTINSGSNLYAIKMRNIDTMKSKVIPQVMALIEKRLTVERTSFGKLDAHVFAPGSRRQQQQPSGDSTALRLPEVCVAVVDDYVIVTDSKYMMRQLSEGINGTEGRLKDALDFQLISDRITAQLQDKQCSALAYARPEESLQLFYELARDPENRKRLGKLAENNAFFKALLSGLEKHELPPFSVIAKYLAPAGGFLVDEETGLHYTSFSLRRE